MPAQMISLTDKVSWSSDQVGASLSDNVMLLSIATGRYYQLDAISSDIWQRLEHPVQVADLCAELTTAYCGDTQTLEQDVLELLGRLEEEQLLQRVS